MPFDQQPVILENNLLRIPQREGWSHIRDHFQGAEPTPEVGIVLPVGCGKSGLIAITPYAVNARRALVIAPGTKIRDQLARDLRVGSPSNFFERFAVIGNGEDLPESALIRSGLTAFDDLEHCDFAVTNIQQIAGAENRWLDQVGPDFFDLILVDEGHHNTAESWQQVKQRFPRARIVNFSATPARADGQLMEGRIIYAFPVLRAIEAGYVKRLRAKMLRPAELLYRDPDTGQQRLIGPEEVRTLGETDAQFRRGIVMSEHSLGTLVDQSIIELRRLRDETGEPRLKIIASALNYDHCISIKEAFNQRNMRAEYVHSREDGAANDRVFARLESHDLDVIVQSRMLGEGFDHPLLAVAMVGSIFANLSPFVQFVGRIMRSVVQNSPGHPLNQGVVVFHVGSNVATRWNDFRAFSQADQDFFSQLLPEAEEVEFSGEAVEREPTQGGLTPIEVLEQRDVRAADMAPIGDPQAIVLLQRLADMGVTPEQAAEQIQRLRVGRQDRRAARRTALNDHVQNEAGAVLGRLGLNHRSRTLDRSRRLNNYAWVASELNRRINERAGGANADRQNFTLEQLDAAHQVFPEVVLQLEEELRRGTA